MDKNKSILLLLCIVGLFFQAEHVQAKSFAMFDAGGNLTNQGVVVIAVGVVAVTALAYDTYQTYFVPARKREKTFIEGCSVALNNTRKYIKSPDGAQDGINGLGALSFIGLATYVEKTVSSWFYDKDSDFIVLKPGQVKTTFKDVAGLQDAKDDMQDIIDFLKNPKKFDAMGAQAPKGVLMYGGPGNGKTLLARAVAGEVNCSFISVTGSSFIEMYVGTGAARVRELFDAARKQGPCIIFIDEIDSLIAKRDGGAGSEHNQTVAAFLAEVDGLQKSKHPIIIIGATNRLDTLDRAAIRPGRFDRTVEVKKPGMLDRATLLAINFKKVKHSADVDTYTIAEMTSGFSGAELTTLVNQSALLAVKENSKVVTMKHITTTLSSIKDTMIKTVDASFEVDIFYPGDMKVTFDDVAGLDEAKNDFNDIISFLKNPNRFNSMGAKIPKGILMDGSPGNGKTLLARAVAGQADCPFISITGSSFVEKYVGTGPARVRELFAKARKEAPCIIFIDEIDALLSARGGNDGGSHERNNTIAAFLAEVDGLKDSKLPIILIGATNRIEALDAAAIRPGRFDRKVHINNPLMQDRLKLLDIKLQNIIHDEDIDMDHLARLTKGFSGAQLAQLINDSALVAVGNQSENVSMKHIIEAYENITVGRPVVAAQLSNEQKSVLAYRKAGHLLGLIEGNAESVDKVSIQPHANSLGFVRSLPVQDTVGEQENMRSQIRMIFCEYFAQQIYKKATVSKQSTDFVQARRIAQEIVSMQNLYGAHRTAKELSDEIECILDEEYKNAEKIIISQKVNLNKLADQLAAKVTMQGDEIYELVGKNDPRYMNLGGKPTAA